MKYFIIIFLLISTSIFAIQFGNSHDKGVIENDAITEASGLVESRKNTNVFWTHNDSGDENVLYAFNEGGIHLGTYTIDDIINRDWEDIAIAIIDSEHYLLVGDIGDNNLAFTEKHIYRIPEPDVDYEQIPVTETIFGTETITVQYPNGNHDAETLLCDPTTNDLYIISKRFSSEEGGVDYLFRATYPQSTATTIEMEIVANLDYPSTYIPGVGYAGATGAEISNSGLEILVKTYSHTYYWERNLGQNIDDVFENEPLSVTYSQEPQGEAICWKIDGMGYYTLSEEYAGIPAHLFFYPRVDNYISLSEIPTDLYKSDELFQVEWLPENLAGEFYYSTSPGGEVISNYTASGQVGTGNIEITAEDLGIGTGNYYCVIHNSEYNYTSIEFSLIIESSQSTQMVNPTNGSIINNEIPVFSWEANPGVPYYFVVISDHPFTVEEDENGETIIVGMQPIWQAVTPNTSINYGDIDPSGYFGGNAPPLVADTEYNWIVANNYGNDPLFTSKVISAPFSFTFETENSIEPPILITPTDNSLINGDIAFHWSEVTDAMTYHIFLYEIRNEGGNIGHYLVWDQVTTDETVTCYAADFLVNAHFIWKVIASDELGVSASSDEFTFHYKIPIGTLQLRIRDPQGNAVSFATAELDPIDGSGNSVPLAVNANGNETKIIPPGDYFLTCSKTGYETADSLITITEDTDLESSQGDVVITIIQEHSPSLFYGDVTDEDGNLLENVDISAIKSNGDTRTTSSSTGSYNIGVIEGFWTISADKESYTLTSPIEAYINAAENIQLPNVEMSFNEKTAEGYVKNLDGNSLFGVNVTAINGNIVRNKTTNSNGFFQFEGLNIGSWTISAEKAGYYSPGVTVIEIDATSPAITTLNDILLTPQANIVMGNVNNGLVGVDDILVKATPAAGQPHTTLTNQYGNYTLSLPAGNFEITAIHAGFYTDEIYQLNLSVAETHENLNFTLIQNDGMICGIVTSEEQFLEGVTVSAGSYQTTSNADGTYSLSVFPGTYTVIATKNHHTCNSQIISINSDQIVSNINFEMIPNASMVTGKILTEGGTGISNATIKGYRTSNGEYFTPATSNGLGGYTLNLHHGTYQIWAEKSGFICDIGDSLEITTAAGQSLPNQNIVLSLYISQIEGTTFLNNGETVGTVNITATNINNAEQYFSTISNNYGNYSLTVTPDIQYEITATKQGYALDETVTTTILEYEESVVHDLFFTPLPSSISGTVYDEFNEIIIGATIQAELLEEPFIITSDETNVTGQFELGVTYGEFQITAYKLGYLQSEILLTVNPGDNIEDINFYLDENFGILEGVITDANTNLPIPNAQISANLAGGGGSTVYSNESGFYQMNQILPGIYYTVIISKANYETTEIENQVVPGGVTIELNQQLVPYSSSILVNAELSGVTISAERIENREIISGITDENGNCHLEGLASGVEWSVTAARTNYSPNPVDSIITLLPNETQMLNFELTLNNSTITGFVTNINQIGLNNVLVSATSNDGFYQETTSTATGQFFIVNLAPFHQYTISAALESYTILADSVCFLETEIDTVNLIMQENNLIISGIVVDQTGQIWENISVEIENENIWCNTNENGEFTLINLAPLHTCQIVTNIVEQGYENTDSLITIDTENIEDVELKIDVHTANIIGLITDENTFEPIADASIIASNGAQNFVAISQPDGSYVLSYLYADDYELTVIEESYQTEIITSVLVEHQQTVEQNFELLYTVPVSVSGILRDTSARPIANAIINLVDARETFSDTTNVDGEFIFTEISPYTNRVIGTNLPSENYENDLHSVEILAENIENIELITDIHSASVFGTINGEFEFLPNVEIELTSEDYLQNFITNENGTFSFTYLYEGNYEILMVRAGYEDSIFTFSLVDFENSNLNFTLIPKTGNIVGTVQNTNGDYLKNVVITLLENEVEIAQDTTSVSGTFAIENLTELHEYAINCEKLGYQFYQHPNLLTTDSTDVEVSLSMIPNSVLGTVYHQNVEFENATIFIKDIENNLTTAQSNEFGDYSISNLTGYYQIWGANADATLVSHTQSTVIDGPQIVQIELLPAAHIIGTVFYNNVPKSGVTIFAMNTNNGMVLSDITETDGTFDVTGLSDGIYNLNIVLDGFTVNEPIPQVEIVDGETTDIGQFTLTFSENAIAGVVSIAETREGISNTTVKLFDAEMTQIDSIITTADGSFLFTNLDDGNYEITATHIAYEMHESIFVILQDGSATPQTADFHLIPKELTIFGQVTDDDQNILQNATIQAVCADNEDDIFIVFTDNFGNYSLSVDSVATYNLGASKEGYHSPENVAITIDYEENSQVEQNFVLEYIQLFADIIGSVAIFDEALQQNVAPENATLQLSNSSGDLLEITITDSLFAFNNLSIPDVFSLEISATYLDQIYHDLAFGIVISEEGVYEQNFNFHYIENTVSLEGNVFMIRDFNQIPLSSVTVQLFDENAQIDSTLTNENGYYQFNNLTEDNYSLIFSANYDNEFWQSEIIQTEWTGENIYENHYFQYQLCNLDFYVMENDETPINGATIQITSTERDILLYTNENGYCTTGSTLHTGHYAVKISKNYGTFGKFIEPKNYFLSLDSLSFYEEHKILPLQFDTSQLPETVSSITSTELLLHRNLDYENDVFLWYFFENSEPITIQMSDDTAELTATIPPQNQSGKVRFWFESTTENLTYSNENNPDSLLITTDGVLGTEYSKINPNQPVFVYNQETIFEVNLFDDAGNSLNDSTEILVEWSLADSTIGTIEKIENESRKQLFRARELQEEDIAGEIYATVSLNGVTINLVENIQIKNMQLAEIDISGNFETDNETPLILTAIANSDSGFTMNIPFAIAPISPIIGEIEMQNNNILFVPNSEYIGNFDITISATDPNFDNEISVSQEIIVFKQINANTNLATLFTDDDCNLLLYEAMLDTISAQQAKLYLNTTNSAPFTEVGAENEVNGKIYNLYSNKAKETFTTMPGLQFATNENLPFVAFWDDRQLEWIVATEDDETNHILENVPKWCNYALVTNSKKLGIYDLKLRPNPFTPYDHYGENMGLQIEFKISSNKTRYPLITAKIYTIDGTLVRTIADKYPLLKGEHLAGKVGTLHWNGKTNGGRMARNGRYVIQLIAEDAQHREEIVKTIILIK